MSQTRVSIPCPNAVSLRPSVFKSATFLEFRAVSALLLLPNCPRPDCRVSDLVRSRCRLIRRPFHSSLSPLLYPSIRPYSTIGFRRTTVAKQRSGAYSELHWLHVIDGIVNAICGYNVLYIFERTKRSTESTEASRRRRCQSENLTPVNGFPISGAKFKTNDEQKSKN